MEFSGVWFATLTVPHHAALAWILNANLMQRQLAA